MLLDLDASEMLFSLQLFVPSLLLVLLLASFLPKSARDDVPEEEIPGIIPVILPISLPRTPLLVSLLVLLSLSHVVSFTWMLVTFQLDPPLISLYTAAAGIVAWSGAAYSVYNSQGRSVGWAKAMGWVGLVGEGWMGAERVWLFVKWTGSFPPGAFPLPSFLLLTLLSVRLLLLVLSIWALYNPVRDFIPAPRRRNGPSSSSPAEGERRGLLSSEGPESSSSSSKDGAVGEGYGTFGESGEEERIEGRGSPSTTSLSQKAATPTATPLPKPSSTDSLVPITAASPADLENENENAMDVSPPSLSPVNENSETSSTAKAPEPILSPTGDDGPPSFAEVVAAPSSSVEPDRSSSSTPASAPPPPPPPPSPPKTPLPTSTSLLFPSLLESTEPSRSPSFDIDAPSTPAAQPNPSSHAVSPSASSTITDSPSVSTKEKRKRLASLSDMGRKMSDEGKGLVRRVSLMGKSKNSSSSTSIPTLASTENLGAAGGGASPSPLNSPGGRSSLSGAGGALPEGREGDGTSSFVSASSSGGGGLKKRLSLLTRKVSSGGSGSTVPAATTEAGEGVAVAVGEEGGGKGKEKKKPFVTKNGRNGKGKKTKSKK
ncbi:hypothetical protein BDY24DRAFT_444177 [Mrakia frigida]|uniref:uncharacterized protein n=1 Tax=Mrakia frigida TaxID=29902 RepID=UPI003FCC1D33